MGIVVVVGKEVEAQRGWVDVGDCGSGELGDEESEKEMLASAIPESWLLAFLLISTSRFNFHFSRSTLLCFYSPFLSLYPLAALIPLLQAFFKLSAPSRAFLVNTKRDCANNHFFICARQLNNHLRFILFSFVYLFIIL